MITRLCFSPGNFKDHAAKPTATIGATDQQKAEPQAPQASPPSSSEVFFLSSRGLCACFSEILKSRKTPIL